MRPRPRGAVKRADPSFNLVKVPNPSLPHPRSHTEDPTPLIITGRQTYTQHHNLPHTRLESNKPKDPTPEPPMPPVNPFTDDENLQVWEMDGATLLYRTPGDESSRTRRRRATQWKRWTEEIIPMLIKPYMQLMATTKSLRCCPPEPGRFNCTCAFGQDVSITVVRFSELEQVVLRRCDKHRISLQLIQRGLFPCAPLVPSLAVDMRVLEFVRVLFLRVSPNATAMSKTFEDCLSAVGFKLETVVRHLSDVSSSI